MKSTFKIALVLGFSTLAACAHHRDVRPGEDNVHKVVVSTDDKEQGSRNAIDQANHFCKSIDENSYAAFLNEEQKYTGDMDEADYQNGKRVAKVAQIAGSGMSVFGGQQAKGFGRAAMIGGSAGDAALGKGYSVDMKFKCVGARTASK